MARTKTIKAHVASDALIQKSIADQVRANGNRQNRSTIENTNHANRPTAFRARHPRRAATSLPAKLLQPSNSPGFSKFLLPATQLCTHPLDHALPVFHCLIHTVPKLLPRKRASDPRTWIYPEPLLTLTKEQKESTWHYMRQIGEAVDWVVSEPNAKKGLHESDEGMATIQRTRPLLRCGLMGHGATITTSVNMVRAAEDAARSGNDAAGEKWHSSQLAILWLHEMSHAVVHAVLPADPGTPEHVFLGTATPTAEVGFEVEQRIFGGTMGLQRDLVPWAGGVYLEEWPDSQTLAYHREMGDLIETRGSSRALTKEWNVVWKVESDFWERMFEEEFWLQDGIAGNLAALHAKRDAGVTVVFKETTLAEEEAIASEMQSMGYAEVREHLWVKQGSAVGEIETGNQSERNMADKSKSAETSKQQSQR
ncbi:unnamed protein product [Zymoseptoria tritici ST99CH_3D1]|nr:unnamed protein product [Zymoseptoria tritici ST99CH_3D1]